MGGDIQPAQVNLPGEVVNTHPGDDLIRLFNRQMQDIRNRQGPVPGYGQTSPDG